MTIKGRPRNWTLERSREVFQLYTSRLRPIDSLYERIFRLMKRRAERLVREEHRELAVPVRI